MKPPFSDYFQLQFPWLSEPQRNAIAMIAQQCLEDTLARQPQVTGRMIGERFLPSCVHEVLYTDDYTVFGTARLCDVRAVSKAVGLLQRGSNGETFW